MFGITGAGYADYKVCAIKSGFFIFVLLIPRFLFIGLSNFCVHQTQCGVGTKISMNKIIEAKL